jgi:hypothetical protein
MIANFLSDTEPNMTKITTILCAAAGALALYASYAAPAGAAPLSAPLAATSADIQSTEAVQYNRRHHSRRGTPRAYFGGGYNSYARAPGYGGTRYFGRGPHSCSREQAEDTGYPSWWCSRIRNYQ